MTNSKLEKNGITEVPRDRRLPYGGKPVLKKLGKVRQMTFGSQPLPQESGGAAGYRG